MKFGIYSPNFGPYGEARVLAKLAPEAESKEAVRLVEQRSELGATWWLECLTPFRAGKGYEDEWPIDAMHERILLGAPQLRKPHK